MRRAPSALLALGCALGLFALGRTTRSDEAIDLARTPVVLRAEASAQDLEAPKPTEFANWHGTSFGSYLPPKGTSFVDETGGVDLVFHFHAAQMADREWRDSTLNAVIVSATFGIGSGYYADALQNPARCSQMVGEVLSQLQRDLPKEPTRPKLHPKRVALVAWSAGFAAVSKILSVPAYYDMVDSVVLLDGLHSSYVGTEKSAAQGEDKVDLRGLASFARFAKDAALGHKQMFISHSNIVPPDYPSTSETTSALLRMVGVGRKAVPPTEQTPGRKDRRMVLVSQADEGLLHVRGYQGKTTTAHFDHLFLVGKAMRELVAPRWRGAPAATSL